jgi:hypothetical protein
MIFEIVFTSILALSIILFFTSNISKMFPMGIKLMPFILIALLWIRALFTGNNPDQSLLSVVLLVIFWVVFCVMVAPAGLGVTLFSLLDREKALAPETIGDPSRKDKICIVYQPGMSDFTIKCIRAFSLKLAEKGYSVTIASAHRRLAVNLKNYKTIGFASPVYAGLIRPPVENFIKRTDLSGTGCFIILTGGDKTRSTDNIIEASKIIASSHGSVIGSKKFFTNDPEQQTKKDLENFAEEIAEKQ